MVSGMTLPQRSGGREISGLSDDSGSRGDDRRGLRRRGRRLGLPPVVTHTGVSGVHRCWRNVDDGQLRAVAERGGVVGVMYHRGFLGGPRAEAVVRHLEHVAGVAGEDTPCLGSDWDGFIVPPSDMATADRLPVLVQLMLDRGWPEARMAKVLGANYLRVLAAVRP